MEAAAGAQPMDVGALADTLQRDPAAVPSLTQGEQAPVKIDWCDDAVIVTLAVVRPKSQDNDYVTHTRADAHHRHRPGRRRLPRRRRLLSLAFAAQRGGSKLLREAGKRRRTAS